MQGNPSATAGIVAARLPTRHRHWRRVGSRAAVRKAGQQGAQGRFLLLFFLRRRWPVATTKKTQQPVDFNFDFFVFFQICFGFFFLLFVRSASPTDRSVMCFFFFSSASGVQIGRRCWLVVNLWPRLGRWRRVDLRPTGWKRGPALAVLWPLLLKKPPKKRLLREKLRMEKLRDDYCGWAGEERTDLQLLWGRSWRRRRCDELCWRETVLLHGEWPVSVFGGEDGLFEL